MIFDRDSKVNFVDENNVVVGFDTCQSCCENFGWFFRSTEPVSVVIDLDDQPDATTLKAYSFDPDYFKEISGPDKYDDTNGVVFRLWADNQPDLFLVLYNSHNGYYSHGFNMDVGGIATKSGSI